MASSAPVTRLDLAALVAAKAEKQLVDEAKSSPNFIPLHLKEVQDEPVPAEGESVVVTPRSRSNSTASARGTPHLDSPSSFASNCSPRVAASGSSANVDRLNTCSECGTFPSRSSALRQRPHAR